MRIELKSLPIIMEAISKELKMRVELKIDKNNPLLNVKNCMFCLEFDKDGNIIDWDVYTYKKDMIESQIYLDKFGNSFCLINGQLDKCGCGCDYDFPYEDDEIVMVGNKE